MELGDITNLFKTKHTKAIEARLETYEAEITKNDIRYDEVILSNERHEANIIESDAQYENLLRMFNEALDFSFTKTGGAGNSDGFRRMGSGSFTRDMESGKLDRAFDAVVEMAHKNSVAKFIVETTADFVVGDGFKYVAEDEAVQDILDEFVDINELDMDAHDKVKELGIFGEQCYRTFIKESTGAVSLGIVDPQNVAGIMTDPENVKKPIKASIITGDSVGTERSFNIINVNEEGFLEGEVFFFKINSVTSISRGLSDLYAVADYIDGFDKVLFNSIERTAFMNAFILDITLKGGDPAKINEFKKNNPSPRPGTSVVHNENVEYDFMSPDLHASDLTIQLKFLLSIIVGTSGFSLPWLGIGDDTNRATAEEMAVPSMKRLQRRQDFVKNMYMRMGKFAIEQAQNSTNNTLSLNANTKFTIEMSSISKKDIESASKSLKDLITAISIAKSSNIMSEDTAVRTVIKANDSVETTIEEELEKIQGDKVTAQEKIQEEMRDNAKTEDEAGD